MFCSEQINESRFQYGDGKAAIDFREVGREGWSAKRGYRFQCVYTTARKAREKSAHPVHQLVPRLISKSVETRARAIAARSVPLAKQVVCVSEVTGTAAVVLAAVGVGLSPKRGP